MMAASNIQYKLSERSRGLACGGIGAMHLLALRTGLVEAIDWNLHLLKVHLSYHEWDHVMNIAYNILAGGTCLDDIELQRNQEAYLDALGAQRIPAPTTEGDFCRRFKVSHIETLMDTINEVRLGVWRRQPAEFFHIAVIAPTARWLLPTASARKASDHGTSSRTRIGRNFVICLLVILGAPKINY